MSVRDAGTLSFIYEIVITAMVNCFNKTQGNRPPGIKFQLRIFAKEKCKQIIYLYFFIRHSKKIFLVYQLLHDKESKELFKKLISFRLTGWKHVKIKEGSNWSDEQKDLNSIQRFYDGVSDLDFLSHSFFGALHHYKNIPTETDPVTLDSWADSLLYVALKKQYYFERNTIKVKPEQGDIIVDAGGCLGDNAVYFAKSVGQQGHVYVFDPLPAHEKVIKKNIAQNQLSEQITCMSYAVGKSSNFIITNCDVNYTTILPPNPAFHLSNNTQFPTISIDDFVRDNGINKIDFIKMDIEGDELSALQGAINTITRFKPKLAISIYHKWQDFYAIPLWIHEIFKGYIFFIDHYTMHTGETILYAISRADVK